MLVAFREPDSYLSGGVRWFDNESGKAVKGFSVFPGGNTGYFYKLNNVGDIDLITQAPDTEVGDRLWLDNNGDGLQGADEPGLAGVTSELYQDGKKVGETGAIQNPQTIIQIPVEEGLPDGMTIDSEGMLWVALWNGWKVVRYNPYDGSKLQEYPLPVSRPLQFVLAAKRWRICMSRPPAPA